MDKAHILIIEDERIVAQDIQYCLKARGYHVDGIASSGEEAIEKAKLSCPDLALMDIGLKGEMDGIEAAEVLRREFGIPVIYLTAYADEGTLERAKITSPFGYILKPFNERELSSTIEMALYKNRMDQELKASEERYRHLVEVLPDIIVVHREGRIEFINTAGARLLGADDSEALIGRRFFDIVDGRFHADILRGIDRITRSDGEFPLLEAKYVRFDGQGLDVEVKAVLITYNGKPAIQSVARDITERKRLETQFLHAQKMEAVGTMAGAIAHDFNNVLTAIIGYGNLLQREMSDNPLSCYVDQILSSGEKAANLTQGLLSFSRKSESHAEPMELNKVVKKADKLLTRLIGEEVHFQTSLWGSDLMVKADKGQLEQVLMNLVTNAKDAMPGGGTLSIHTELIEIDSEFVRSHGYGAPGAYAVISVSDTGVGIDKDTAARIFEPFFTTKDEGKGTGLGLSTVYGIIKQHNGYVNVYSEPGIGTLFTIYLPLIESMEKEEETEGRIRPQDGNEVVLLAEDDEQARNLMKTILEAYGYKVFAVADGEDAVNTFKAKDKEIGLAILDVIMPKKGGKAVHEEILKMKPGIKVLFMSGYSSDIIKQKGVFEQNVNFIQKPIMPDMLLKKVRETLDREGDAASHATEIARN